MKPPEIESRLWHIEAACQKVMRVTSGKTIEAYIADDLLPDVVVRQLTIIGEAVARIARIDQEVAAQLGDFPRIVAFRNQLVHNYPHIEHDAVWVIVTREVPLLLERIRALLPPLDSNGAHPA
jgi:uncharacterized protein with HEPN domain